MVNFSFVKRGLALATLVVSVKHCVQCEGKILDFAEKLIENGYQSLGAKYYELALAKGEVKSSGG